jgi:hypothetical protein
MRVSEFDDQLAARATVTFHQAMRGSNLLKLKYLRGLGFIGASSNTIHDRLEWNLRQWELGRSGHESTGKHTEVNSARDLEYRLECERTAPAQEADEIDMSPAAHHGERIERGRVPNDIEYRIDSLWIPLPDTLREVRRLNENLRRAPVIWPVRCSLSPLHRRGTGRSPARAGFRRFQACKISPMEKYFYSGALPHMAPQPDAFFP